MIEGAVLVVGLLAGWFFGRRVWGGPRVATEDETCLYFCQDGTTKETTCKPAETTKCLTDLADDCPGVS